MYKFIAYNNRYLLLKNIILACFLLLDIVIIISLISAFSHNRIVMGCLYLGLLILSFFIKYLSTYLTYCDMYCFFSDKIEIIRVYAYCKKNIESIAIKDIKKIEKLELDNCIYSQYLDKKKFIKNGIKYSNYYTKGCNEQLYMIQLANKCIILPLDNYAYVVVRGKTNDIFR